MWKQKAAQVKPIVIPSTAVIPKSLSQSLTRQPAPKYIHTAAKICNYWHMFSCKKLFKLQIRPPSLILLITTSQDRWIFPSQNWDVRNSIIIIIIIIIIIYSNIFITHYQCTSMFYHADCSVIHVESLSSVCWLASGDIHILGYTNT